MVLSVCNKLAGSGRHSKTPCSQRGRTAGKERAFQRAPTNHTASQQVATWKAHLWIQRTPIERVKLAILCYAFVADVRVQFVPCVVVCLAGSIASGPSIDTWIHNDVVRATNLVVASEVFAATVHQEILWLQGLRAHELMLCWRTLALQQIASRVAHGAQALTTALHDSLRLHTLVSL